MFCHKSVRPGVMPRMLEEILDTRVMVKRWMQRSKKNKVSLFLVSSPVTVIYRLSVSAQILHRILDSRQHGLKMIANVTYGYVSASFSGRMPCVQFADAIVGTGRDALNEAMRLIQQTEEWNADVLYGDTDRFVFAANATKAACGSPTHSHVVSLFASRVPPWRVPGKLVVKSRSA